MPEAEINPAFPKHMFTVLNDPVHVNSDPKILILIPSKNRNDLLFQCINSIITHTSKDLNGITIAIVDTGSSTETLDDIRFAITDAYVYDNVIIKLLKHGYYNFAKNNNQAFKEMNGSEFDYVLFCNNDIKLLNDAISNMVQTFEMHEDVGTVGARLHFGDGTIQHLGAFITVAGQAVAAGHYGFRRATTGSILTGAQPVQANTCAFMMMKAQLFDELMFNEKYVECFEDMQLNLSVGIMGYQNYCALDAVAFHYESLSRDADTNKVKKQNQDLQLLSIFVQKNKDTKFMKKIMT